MVDCKFYIKLLILTSHKNENSLSIRPKIILTVGCLLNTGDASCFYTHTFCGVDTNRNEGNNLKV